MLAGEAMPVGRPSGAHWIGPLSNETPMFALSVGVTTMKLATRLLGLMLIAAPVAAQTVPGTSVDARTLPTVDEQVVPANLLSSPPEGKEARPAGFVAAIGAVRRAGVLEKSLAVGDKAVDFELQDAAGYRIQASEMWATGPLVVEFYRGGWSPYCNAHLQAMQQALRAIHTAGGQFVAIGPDSAEEGLAMQDRNKLTFPVLSDKGNAVARQFGLVYHASEMEIPVYVAEFDNKQFDAERGFELPLATTYVIDTGGVIRYAFRDADPSRRVKPQAVLDALGRMRRNEAEPRPVRTVPVERTAGIQ